MQDTTSISDVSFSTSEMEVFHNLLTVSKSWNLQTKTSLIGLPSSTTIVLISKSVSELNWTFVCKSGISHKNLLSPHPLCSWYWIQTVGAWTAWATTEHLNKFACWVLLVGRWTTSKLWMSLIGFCFPDLSFPSKKLPRPTAAASQWRGTTKLFQICWLGFASWPLGQYNHLEQRGL